MSDRPRDRAEFDPRFDPAFQPGYDPSSDPMLRAREVPERRRDVAVPRSPGEPSTARIVDSRVGAPPAPHPPAPQPQFGPPLPDPPLPGSRSPVALRGSEPADEPASEPAATARDLVRNPFVVVLWALGLVFVIAGIGTLRTAAGLLDSLGASSEAGLDFLLFETLQSIGPQLIVLGLAVTSAPLLLFAARWRARG